MPNPFYFTRDIDCASRPNPITLPGPFFLPEFQLSLHGSPPLTISQCQDIHTSVNRFMVLQPANGIFMNQFRFLRLYKGETGGEGEEGICEAVMDFQPSKNQSGVLYLAKRRRGYR